MEGTERKGEMKPGLHIGGERLEESLVKGTLRHMLSLSASQTKSSKWMALIRIGHGISPE